MTTRQPRPPESLGHHDHGDPGGDAEKLTAALRPGTALLVVNHRFGGPARFLLDQPVSLAGRHPDAEIFLDDVTASRRHAQIVRCGEGFILRDLDSINGTYLNGRRVTQAPLAAGDRIIIGKFRLRFLPSR